MNSFRLEMETDELFHRIRKRYRFFKRSRTFEREYRPLVPPYFEKSSAIFTPTERKVYYDWFMKNLEPRSEYLRCLVAKDAGVAIDSLDYSFESLLPVWKWFLARARILVKRNLPPYEYAWRHKPGNADEKVSNKYSMRFDVKTEMMIRDVGMYVGMVFTRAFPGTIAWECQSLKDMSVNLPVLTGFEQKTNHLGMPLEKAFRPCFEPIHMVGVQAAGLFHDEGKPEDLYNVCSLWKQWVPNTVKEDSE